MEELAEDGRLRIKDRLVDLEMPPLADDGEIRVSASGQEAENVSIRWKPSLGEDLLLESKREWTARLVRCHVDCSYLLLRSELIERYLC